ncbi:MAG: acyl-CoA thioesterase [Brevinematales bacterium]|jgi:acyl-CoA thioester hydrolase
MANRKIISYFPPDEKPPLCSECSRRVQFDEVDSLRIVWHGRYVSYFEHGRNDWGRKFGFTYQKMAENGFAMPVVKMGIDYFSPLLYDELFGIKTMAHWTEASKMNMSYEIYSENGTLSVKGYTVQLYTDFSGRPLILRPDYAENFIGKWDDWCVK